MRTVPTGVNRTGFAGGFGEALSIELSMDTARFVVAEDLQARIEEIKGQEGVEERIGKLSGAVGVIEFSLTNNAPLIYPNPIDKPATLAYTLQHAETISIHLLDMQGKTVGTFVEGEEQAAGEHQLSIDLPVALPSGTYLIAISSPKGKLTVQVVK